MVAANRAPVLVEGTGHSGFSALVFGPGACPIMIGRDDDITHREPLS